MSSSDQPSAAIPRAAGPQAEAPVTPGEEAIDPAAPPTLTAGPQADTAVTPRQAPATAPAMLDDDQRALLTAVLDHLIPATDMLPGAGALGAGAAIEQAMAVTPTLRRLLLDLLVTIQLASVRATGQDVGALDAEAAAAVLRTVELAQPAAFAALVDHAYRGYYPRPAVHAALNFPTRPPQPLGHTLPPFDPALLAQQRQRAPFWRRTT